MHSRAVFTEPNAPSAIMVRMLPNHGSDRRRTIAVWNGKEEKGLVTRDCDPSCNSSRNRIPVEPSAADFNSNPTLNEYIKRVTM